MSTLQEITTEADFHAHTSSLPSSALLVLYFHTPWAAPCAQMHTVLSTLASSYPASAPPHISFVSVNAEDLPEISEAYDVTAVPFVVLARAGEVLQSVSGSDPVKVREAIEKHAGSGSSNNTSAAGAAAVGSSSKQTIPPALSTTPREQPPTSALDTAGVDGVSVTPAPQQPEGQQQQAPSREELFARLGELVKAAPVMLFMKGTPSAPQCGFSRQLVGVLREHGVKYGFFNILADEDVRQGLKEFAEWPTYPQLWVKGELVGGLDIVKEEVSADAEFFNDYAVPRVPAASPA